MRLCNFCVPKRVKTRKGPKSVPYGIFLFSRWRYPEIMDTDQSLSGTGLNFTTEDRPNYRSQNLPTSQTPIFGGKLEIRTMAVRRYQAGSRACQISNPTNTRSHCYRAPYFWSKKWGNAQNPLCHAHIPNFNGRFCTCGGNQPSPENLGQIHLANLM